MSAGWRCAPGIRWVRDSDRLLVVAPAGGCVFPLVGEEAALWSWLAAGLPETAAAAFLAEWNRCAPAEAALRVEETLTRWRAAGLLAAAEVSLG